MSSALGRACSVKLRRKRTGPSAAAPNLIRPWRLLPSRLPDFFCAAAFFLQHHSNLLFLSSPQLPPSRQHIRLSLFTSLTLRTGDFSRFRSPSTTNLRQSLPLATTCRTAVATEARAAAAAADTVVEDMAEAPTGTTTTAVTVMALEVIAMIAQTLRKLAITAPSGPT